MSQSVINMQELDGRVFIGRPRGESSRQHFHIESLDGANEKVLVVFPENTYSVTSSFFLGMFGPSIMKFGSAEGFFSKYEFRVNPVFMKLFKDYAHRALQSKNLFDSSN